MRLVQASLARADFARTRVIEPGRVRQKTRSPDQTRARAGTARALVLERQHALVQGRRLGEVRLAGRRVLGVGDVQRGGARRGGGRRAPPRSSGASRASRTERTARTADAVPWRRGGTTAETLSARNGDASRAAAVFSVNRVEPRFANASLVSRTSRVSVSEDVASSSSASGSTEARAGGHAAVRGRGRAAPRRTARRRARRRPGSRRRTGGSPRRPSRREITAPPRSPVGNAAALLRGRPVPPRRSGLADGRQRLGRIRIGAASANGRGDGSAGRDGRTGSRATRCGPVLVVPRDGPRLGDA